LSAMAGSMAITTSSTTAAGIRRLIRQSSSKKVFAGHAALSQKGIPAANEPGIYSTR
jgi:hypothetical protein